MSHKLEELISDSLSEAQSTEGKGNDGGEKGQRHHQVALGERGRDPVGKEHSAHDEEGQDAQSVADHREAEAGQNDAEPLSVGGRHGLELRRISETLLFPVRPHRRKI